MADLIRIAIVEDHPATAHGLGELLSAEPDIEVVGIAGDLAGARRLLREARPDVLLCDIELPDGRAFELLAQCHGTARVATILFSSYDYAAFHQRAHELGAAGYLLKTATTHEIVTAVRTVAVGGAAFDLHHLDVARTAPRPPSERNLELIRLVAGGEENSAIATRLGIGLRGVESELRRLFDRYGVDNRTELAMLALREGWLKSPPALDR